MVEGARLEYECAVHPAPRVRIPPSPQIKILVFLQGEGAMRIVFRIALGFERRRRSTISRSTVERNCRRARAGSS